VTAQESGAGLADVAVLVTAPSGQVISIASTDVTGHYDALVPSGSYRVTFFNDYAHVAATRQHLDGSYAGGIVTVTAPGMTLGINAAFAVGAQISGRITNTSGEPLRDMLVRVVDPAGILITTTLTDLDGHYITPGLAAGAYQLSFQPAPGSRAPEYARVTASLSVAAAEQHTGFDVVLSH
jgi:hypothetical protein